MASVAERSCQCGYFGPHLTRQGRPPHGEQVNCGGCGAFLGYLRKLQNVAKRRPNGKYRSYWRARMGGSLRCGMCGGVEDEGYPVSFEIDHIWQVEDGGVEEDERNTMPLCADCHQFKNIIRALRLHARGRSARNGASEVQS